MRHLWTISRWGGLLAGLWLLGAQMGCGPERTESPPPSPTAGALTIADRTSHAYTLPAPNLDEMGNEQHLAGDAAFEAQFVSPPAEVNPGLGPTFNNNNCNACHIQNGRGMPVVDHPSLRSQMLVRVSAVDAQGLHGGPAPIEGVGTQLQDQAIYGERPEAHIDLTWETVEGEYADGTAYELRKPVLEIEPAEGTTLPDEYWTSLRQPPPVIGLGLLEALPPETLRELADPDDADGDGISGRPNRVWDVEAERKRIGRFGLKANQPDLLQQSAAAYHDDMGVTNDLFPGEDGATELDRQTLEDATFYAQTLAVPGRAPVTDAIRRGERLFGEAGCADCHTETLETGAHEIEALEDQRIHPYTDLLLHDMGPGLADGRPDYEASGREWRTPPLWGIGLTQTVLPGARYLHDGRARTLAEAILWHGGEGEGSKEAFRTMSEGDREALIAFLRSL